MLRNKVRKISNKLGTHFKLEHDGVKCQTLHWLALELGTDDRPSDRNVRRRLQLVQTHLARSTLCMLDLPSPKPSWIKALGRN